MSPSRTCIGREIELQTSWLMSQWTCIVGIRDENIRYIRRYISDISDIGDVRHDIGDDRYIADISVFD